MAQNFGNPFVNFTYKPGMSAQERVDMAKEIAKGFGNRVLGHPEGTTLEIAEAQNLSTENPQRWLIEESDREVLYILLGQTGSTISTQGKLGGEETHNSVKQERVAGAAEWVAQTSLDQFARSVLLVNYEEDSECPAIKPDFTKPLNALEVGTLCTALTSSKMPFKAEEVFQKTGFTQPEKGDVVIQNGEIKIQGDALTPEEKQKQELDLQKKQMQLAGQKKPAVQAKAVADYLEQSFRGMDSRLVLAKATDEEIDELEKMVTAAELAPHQNGEYHALTAKITQLSNRRN
jgi:hypothetical protein